MAGESARPVSRLQLRWAAGIASEATGARIAAVLVAGEDDGEGKGGGVLGAIRGMAAEQVTHAGIARSEARFDSICARRASRSF